MPNVHEPIRDHVTLSIRCAPIAWASSFRSASPGRHRPRRGLPHARDHGPDGVEPSLHVEYKSSHVKQYFKGQRALRTETTINDDP